MQDLRKRAVMWTARGTPLTKSPDWAVLGPAGKCVGGFPRTQQWGIWVNRSHSQGASRFSSPPQATLLTPGLSVLIYTVGLAFNL